MSKLTSVDTTRNLDHAYDQYLAAHRKPAREAIALFQKQLKQSALKYGRFTIPSFLKPHFMTAKQAKLCRTAAEAFSAMVNKVIHLYFNEPVFAQNFHLSKEMEELVRIDPGYSKNAIVMRLDGFLEGDSLKWIEFNCDSPAGMVYADLLEDLLFETEELKTFFGDFQCRHENRCQKLLSALLNVYEEFGGYETPNIAIVDWRTVRTKSEFETLKTFFEGKGYKTTVADPRDLRYKTGKLYHGNFRIDLLYRRAITSELLERSDDVRDLIKAYRERAVCMVNPLRSRLASSKALLSIFTNPEYDRFFTDQENEIKRSHIPWTRRLIEAEKFYGGRMIYLINFLKDEKETLVLKPAEGYGGKNVMIGGETRDEDWNEAIDRAIKNNWVVQEFVKPPVMTVPALINDKLDFEYKKVNMGIYILDQKFASGISRLSDETVINVSRGGGVIPMIASEETINR